MLNRLQCFIPRATHQSGFVSKRTLSDALFVHRETDADAEKFQWDDANKKVKIILQFVKRKL